MKILLKFKYFYRLRFFRYSLRIIGNVEQPAQAIAITVKYCQT